MHLRPPSWKPDSLPTHPPPRSPHLYFLPRYVKGTLLPELAQHINTKVQNRPMRISFLRRWAGQYKCNKFKNETNSWAVFSSCAYLCTKALLFKLLFLSDVAARFLVWFSPIETHQSPLLLIMQSCLKHLKRSSSEKHLTHPGRGGCISPWKPRPKTEQIKPNVSSE